MVIDDFYRAFEDRFRGNRDVIKARQTAYLPVVEAILKRLQKKLLDVSSERAEWLALLAERGLAGDAKAVREGQHAGASAITSEAFEFLRQQDDQSCGVISAFHLIGHFDLGKLLAFLTEAHRVLDSGGAVVLETSNPANLLVGAHNLCVEPASMRLISPALLSIAAEFAGFERVVAVSANSGLSDDQASPDFAVIAFKNSDNPFIPLAESLVTTGLPPVSQSEAGQLHALFSRALAGETDPAPRHANTNATAADLAQVKQRALESEARARQSEASEEEAQRRIKALTSQIDTLQARLRDAGIRTAAAEATAKNLDEHVNAILASTSWRLSSPVRVVGTAGRKVGVAPSAVNRTVKLSLLHAVAYVRSRPVLRQRVANTLARFPRVRARLVRLVGYRALQGVVSGSPLPAVESVDRMTARGRAIYQDLLNAKNGGTQ